MLLTEQIDFKNKTKNLFEMKNSKKIIAVIGVLGVILIMLSEFIPQNKSNESSKTNSITEYSDYKESLEKQLLGILSSIQGVGKCKVMITLEETQECVFAKNEKAQNSQNDNSSENEYVIIDNSGNETPVLIKEYFPKVLGVAIVCEGAENSLVCEEITNSVTALFDISSNRISVSKYESE